MVTASDEADPQDRIILAFSPSDGDYAREGYIWSLYNPALENPYTVEGASKKINAAMERIDPDEYTCRDHEHWIRVEWESVMDGDPVRLHVSDD